MNTAHKYDILHEFQDEQLDNELFQDEEYMSKTLHAVSVSDLMGEDHSVWIKRNPKFGFDVEIQNDENTFDVFQESGIHAYAIEGFAEFCRRFLHSYSNLMDGGLL